MRSLARLLLAPAVGSLFLWMIVPLAMTLPSSSSVLTMAVQNDGSVTKKRKFASPMNACSPGSIRL